MGGAIKALLSASNVNGFYDETLAKLENAMSGIDKALSAADTGLSGAVNEQKQLIDAAAKQEQTIEGYKKQITEMQGEADKVAKTLADILAAADSAANGGKAMGDGAAGGFAKADKAGQEYIRTLDTILEKQKLVALGSVKGGASSVEGFSYGNINDQVSQAEKTQ